MPPRAKAPSAEDENLIKDVKNGVDAPEAHDPKRLVEQSDTKDEPLKTSGAVPVEVPVVDSAPPAESTLVETAEYGKVSVADLKEILRAELAAEAAQERREEDSKLPELCKNCFPEGWESKNAVGQDAVGCEHGSWSRTKAKE